MTFNRRFNLFLKKELILMARGLEQTLTTVFFVLLVVLLLHFGFGNVEPTTAVWLVTVFAFLIRLNRSYDAENEGKIWMTFKMIPGLASPFFLSKTLTNFLYAIFLELVALVLVIVFYNVREPQAFFLLIMPPLVVGALGLSFIGTTFAGLLGSEGRRDLLLPVIFYPISIPLVLAVMQSIQVSSDGGLGMSLNTDWMRFLIVFDVIYVVASYLVFDYLMEGS